jgi:hypothetical protein
MTMPQKLVLILTAVALGVTTLFIVLAGFAAMEHEQHRKPPDRH